MSIMISDVRSPGTDNSTIIGQGDDRIIRPGARHKIISRAPERQ
jgi:virulence-associated protein VagC